MALCSDDGHCFAIEYEDKTKHCEVHHKEIDHVVSAPCVIIILYTGCIQLQYTGVCSNTVRLRANTAIIHTHKHYNLISFVNTNITTQT